MAQCLIAFLQRLIDLLSPILTFQITIARKRLNVQ